MQGRAARNVRRSAWLGFWDKLHLCTGGIVSLCNAVCATGYLMTRCTGGAGHKCRDGRGRGDGRAQGARRLDVMRYVCMRELSSWLELVMSATAVCSQRCGTNKCSAVKLQMLDWCYGCWSGMVCKGCIQSIMVRYAGSIKLLVGAYAGVVNVGATSCGRDSSTLVKYSTAAATARNAARRLAAAHKAMLRRACYVCGASDMGTVAVMGMSRLAWVLRRVHSMQACMQCRDSTRHASGARLLARSVKFVRAGRAGRTGRADGTATGAHEQGAQDLEG